MDIELERKLTEITEHLKDISTDSVNYQTMDPIARMMLVALLHESQKIQDSIDGVSDKIIDRFCENFIPRDVIDAMPAIALVAPNFKKGKNTEALILDSSVPFTYKVDGHKNPLEFIPLFKNTLIPYDDLYVITRNKMTSKTKTIDVDMGKENVIWIGINTLSEIESLKSFSFYIQGEGIVTPKRISVISNDTTELQFSSMHRLEDIEMLEPFDAQQASGKFLPILKYWKEYLQELPDGALFYISDDMKDRDVFKKKTYPRIFQNWLESDVLDCFDENTLWLQIEFPDGYIVPEACSVRLNTLPVVNISVNTVKLTQSEPIAKLQKQEDSFFIQVLETTNSARKQEYSKNSDDIVVRDFDAACYNNGDLYRDVRNLYNRFVEDYHAFVKYNDLKDGEDIKRLMELINRIGKSVGKENSKYKFDSGTYVMKKVGNEKNVITVSYISTQGKLGNLLETKKETEETKKETEEDINKQNKKSPTLECRKMPLIDHQIPVVVKALGGKDKESADTRYEKVRYYSLTNDRLYTKMDIEAYVREELVCVYGKEEFKRIFVKLTIEGVGGERAVQRGLYIDIKFKDKKNYDKAVSLCLDNRLLHGISNKSCIAMPVIIRLFNLEE